MDNNRQWINYDWFKLFVALIFLVLFLVLLVTMRPVPSSAITGLPEYPAASFTWNYDPGSRTLTNLDGKPVYQLNSDGTMWQPIIPGDIQSRLPQVFQLEWDAANGWVLRAADGGLLFTWDREAINWNPAQPAVDSLPELTVVNPTPDASNTLFPTETPTEIPAAAVTGVPTEIPAPKSTASTTDVPTVMPEATTAPVTAVTGASGCVPPIRSRLVVGKNARILSNLNQRSEPGLGDNIIMVNPAGEVLKLLDGPVCVTFQNSAYLWWQVENMEGIIGWSVENLLSGGGYFLAPLP